MSTHFRCHVGGEWKPLSSFSATQQLKIRDALNRRRPIDPSSTKMTCMDHASGGEEIECAYCNKRKPLDSFSKNNRKSDDPKCKQCVAWIEIQEPEITPGYLTGGHKSFEEDGLLAYGEIRPSQRAILAASAPTTLSPLQTLGLDKATASSISTIRSTAASSQSLSVGVRGTGSAASSKKAPTALPPHLQARFVNKSNDNTSEANSIVKIEDTDSDIGAGQWSPVASKKRHIREGNRSEAPDRQHSTSFSQSNMSKGQPQPDITVDDNKKSRKKGAWVKTERFED